MALDSQRHIWRQLEELKSLDKVFPDPARTIGLYVQTPQGDKTATSEQLNFGKIETISAESKSSES